MNREQLAHVLRAAATIAHDGDILVIGSQSILGTRDATQLPADATMSVEADLVFFDDPDEAKSDLVDGNIGEGSAFHQTYGYYAQGVSMSTAVLPAGWRDRLVPFQPIDAEPSHAQCLEPHDLVIAKLVASRDKDRDFVIALMREQLLDIRLLLERTAELGQPEAVRQRVRTTIEACARRAGYG